MGANIIMNILYVYSDEKKEWNCSNWRCAMPARAINKTKKHKARLLHIRKWENPDIVKSQKFTDWADVIVLQRRILFRTMELMLYAQSEGRKVVVDLDDSYHQMDWRNATGYNFWKNNIARTADGKKVTFKIPVLTQLEMGVKIANKLTSPSKLICSDWKHFIDNTHYLPNYIPTKMYAQRKYNAHLDRDHFIIGWGGGISHINSFLNNPVTQAIDTVLKRSNAKFIIVGDPRLKQLFKDHKNLTVLNWMKEKEWCNHIKEIDIGIAPLNHSYDQRRSSLKVLEYMACGVPWIATEGAPYGDFKEYGNIVSNTVSSWRNKLTHMINNYSYHQDIAKENLNIIKHYDLYNNADNIVKVYEEI